MANISNIKDYVRKYESLTGTGKNLSVRRFVNNLLLQGGAKKRNLSSSTASDIKKRSKLETTTISGIDFNELFKALGESRKFLEDPIWYVPETCLLVTLKNKKYLIRVLKPTTPSESNKFQKLCKIKKEQDLEEIDDGVYTYMRVVSKTNRTDQRMIFTKNYTQSEICSKHSNIYYSALVRKKVTLEYNFMNAGEFMKKNGTYTFNFLSGTFSRREYELKNKEEFERNFRQFLNNHIDTKKSKIIITVGRTNTLITKGSNRSSMTEKDSIEYLQMLAKAGVKFYLYEYEKPKIEISTHPYIHHYNEQIKSLKNTGTLNGYGKPKLNVQEEIAKINRRKANKMCAEHYWEYEPKLPERKFSENAEYNVKKMAQTNDILKNVGVIIGD